MKLPAPWQGQRRKDREPEARAGPRHVLSSSMPA
jgi:hypothetical protein